MKAGTRGGHTKKGEGDERCGGVKRIGGEKYSNATKGTGKKRHYSNLRGHQSGPSLPRRWSGRVNGKNKGGKGRKETGRPPKRKKGKPVASKMVGSAPPSHWREK